MPYVQNLFYLSEVMISLCIADQKPVYYTGARYRKKKYKSKIVQLHFHFSSNLLKIGPCSITHSLSQNNLGDRLLGYV